MIRSKRVATGKPQNWLLGSLIQKGLAILLSLRTNAVFDWQVVGKPITHLSMIFQYRVRPIYDSPS